MNINLLSVFIMVSVFISGCAGLNEGAVDYRVIARESSDVSNTSHGLNGYRQKFFSTGAAIKLIEKDQSVSVKLMTAYICDFREAKYSFNLLKSKGNDGDKICEGASSASTRTAGEIAIIVNAFERNGTNKVTFDASSIDKGRLVYYGNDVRASGQQLNFTNLPVYGPITYNGNPFFIAITIIELDDEENKKLSSVLGSLSSLGSKAFPPSSDVLGVLNSIGSTLLSGSQNDTEFKYHLELDPPGGSGTVFRAPLATGYYVFIRSEQRNLYEKKTKDLILEEETGKLYVCRDKTTEDKKAEAKKTAAKKTAAKKTAAKGKTKPCGTQKKVYWTGGTYLTFKIDTNESTVSLDTQQIFADFKGKQSELIKRDITEFAGFVEKAAEQIGKSANLVSMRNSLNRVKKSNLPDAKKRLNALEFVQVACADYTNGKTTTVAGKNSEESVELIEKFNLIASSEFNPTMHCLDKKSSFVKALIF